MSSESKKKGAKAGERIAKVMARAGLCSRREAERWIESGRVQVNGATLESAACVVTGKDKIVIDGKPLQSAEKTRLFLYHKPAGLVTSARDEKGRATVFDKLPEGLPRLISIGRLDLNTEGLLLLTNDGELSRYLELPATGLVRRYRVRVRGRVDERKLEKLKNGIVHEGIKYGRIDAEIDGHREQASSNIWLIVSLQEGKNREVRNAMAAIGLQTSRLIRLSYGSFQLGNLPKSEVREVPEKALKEQIKGFFKK